jgi:hypothetical protein
MVYGEKSFLSLQLPEVYLMLKVSVSLDWLCDDYEINSEEISHLG